MMNYDARDYETGKLRLQENDIKRIPLSHKGAELLYIPNKTGERSKFIIYAPGGGYLKCWPDEVAATCAAEANILGYNAFILKYRVVIPQEKYAPINDLAEAIDMIIDCADLFNVDPLDYLLIGFSAGGNLAGLFASKVLGCGRYGLPRPGVLGLAYPWTNLPASNVKACKSFQMAFKLGQKMASNLLLGLGHSKKAINNLCVHHHVDKDYPPCYLVHGDSDDMVPHFLNSEIMARTLDEKGIKYEYRIAPGMSHGFGIGRNSTADGWHKECIEFWEKNIQL